MRLAFRSSNFYTYFIHLYLFYVISTFITFNDILLFFKSLNLFILINSACISMRFFRSSKSSRYSFWFLRFAFFFVYTHKARHRANRHVQISRLTQYQFHHGICHIVNKIICFSLEKYSSSISNLCDLVTRI